MNHIHLRYKIEQSFYIVGISVESLNIKSSFNYNSFEIMINFEYRFKEPIVYKYKYKESFYIIYINEVKNINIEISNIDEDGYNKLKNSIGEVLLINNENINNAISHKQMQKTELYNLLVKITNFILKNIRVVGKCPFVHELPIKPEKANSFLYTWEAEKKENEEKWIKIIQIAEDSDLTITKKFSLFSPISNEKPQSYLSALRWYLIEEAINDKLGTDIQDELMVNSKEFLDLGNTRMAVIECLIALDVVLKEYTNHYYEKKDAPSDIKNYISNPNFMLSEKIATIVFLIIKERHKFDNNFIESIIRMNKLRNDIIHRGKVLSDSEEKFVVEKGYNSIKSLVEILADEINNLKLETNLRDKLINLSQKHNIPTPVVQIKGRHNFYVSISFLGLGVKYPIPDKEKMNEITIEIIKIIENYDKFFNKEKNLRLEFTQGFYPPTILSYWTKNKLLFKNE